MSFNSRKKSILVIYKALNISNAYLFGVGATGTLRYGRVSAGCRPDTHRQVEAAVFETPGWYSVDRGSVRSADITSKPSEAAEVPHGARTFLETLSGRQIEVNGGSPH